MTLDVAKARAAAVTGPTDQADADRLLKLAMDQKKSDCKVETVVGDLLVPEGTRVFVLTRPAACDPDYFVEPLAFRPGRWLGEHAGVHDVSAHIPFGSGPRICPGRGLALLEMKLLLSMLFRNFDVERVGRAEGVLENFAFAMSPVGLNVRLRRRSSALAGTGTA